MISELAVLRMYLIMAHPDFEPENLNGGKVSVMTVEVVYITSVVAKEGSSMM